MAVQLYTCVTLTYIVTITTTLTRFMANIKDAMPVSLGQKSLHLTLKIECRVGIQFVIILNDNSGAGDLFPTKNVVIRHYFECRCNKNSLFIHPGKILQKNEFV